DRAPAVGVDGYGEPLRCAGECARRRIHRSSGSHPPWNRPGAVEGGSGTASDPEAGRFLDPRPADERAEKVRSQKGPSRSPILQPVIWTQKIPASLRVRLMTNPLALFARKAPGVACLWEINR